MKEEVCTTLPHRCLSSKRGAHHDAASKEKVTPEIDASSPARQPSMRYTSETEWPRNKAEESTELLLLVTPAVAVPRSMGPDKHGPAKPANLILHSWAREGG